jgi:hypothetical protein
MADKHSTSSTLRERIVEYVFVGEALRNLWRRGVVDADWRIKSNVQPSYQSRRLG